MRQGFPIILAAVAALFLVGRPADAQTPEAAARVRLVSVVGEGIVHVPPDLATIGAGVVSEAPSAGEALAANSTAMRRIIDALKAQGMEARDLQTSGFSVEPRYSQPPQNYDGSEPFVPKIVGYTVRNDLTLKVRDLAKVGALLDQVIGLGANSVSGPNFTVADPTPQEDAARRAAVADAMHKGKLYAEAAGVALGPVLRIEESVAQWPQPVPMAAMAREAAPAPPVPIEGGEIAFRAEISIAWQLAE
jgi:uncharacterized protein YggE